MSTASVLCSEGLHDALLLFPWQLAIPIFLYLVVPTMHTCGIFLVPYSFSVFRCSRRGCPGISTVAKGPRSQPVSLSFLFNPSVNEPGVFGLQSPSKSVFL